MQLQGINNQPAAWWKDLIVHICPGRSIPKIQAAESKAWFFFKDMDNPRAD